MSKKTRKAICFAENDVPLTIFSLPFSPPFLQKITDAPPLFPSRARPGRDPVPDREFLKFFGVFEGTAR